MNNKVKSGLAVGFVTTIFLAFNSIISWVTGQQETTEEILNSLFASLASGLIAGLLFSWFTDKYLVFSLFAKAAKFDLDNNEAIFLKKQANFLQNNEGIGGHLCITDKRLIFKSYISETKNKECVIKLDEISRIETFRTLGIVNNGIKIITKNEVDNRFVVDNQKKWQKLINEIG